MSSGLAGFYGWSGDPAMPVINNCPQCGEPMAIVTQIDGEMWLCRCGYRHQAETDTDISDYEDWCQRE